MYITLNRDWKQHHMTIILPVQLTPLVGYEMRFTCYCFDKHKKTGTIILSSLRSNDKSCYGGSHRLAFPTEEIHPIVPFQSDMGPSTFKST